MFDQEIIIPVLKSIKDFFARNAFCINDVFYTYKQFGEIISKIRIAIKNVNFTNSQVGLVVNDDIETYASIIALWLEGKFYVPLHPDWPLERCLDIVKQVGVDLILDSSESRTRYVEVGKNFVLKTNHLEYDVEYLEYNVNVSDDELAYILFTSGSTGKPKGVMITRENVASFMNSFWQTGIIINEEDKCLQCFDLTFDVSVQGYLVALTRGACVYTVPHGQIKYMYVSGLIEDHGLTFGAMAPSMLRYMKPYFKEIDATSLKTCILTAEACPLNLMNDWYDCATNTRIYDFYGPTEGTIYATCYKLNKHGDNKTLNGIISIGKPLANVKAIIINGSGDIVPVGKKGELCISGAQVTKGYWNDEEKNSTSFFYKDINGQKVRFYRTGDLCYQDKDGDIMYSGRLDHQIKIQGFRVELGEIEFHVREFLRDKNVVCIAFENAKNFTEIAMFIESEPFDTKKLLEFTRVKMPSYMIPTKIVFCPFFPLNMNEKVDKNRLKEYL